MVMKQTKLARDENRRVESPSPQQRARLDTLVDRLELAEACGNSSARRAARKQLAEELMSGPVSRWRGWRAVISTSRVRFDENHRAAVMAWLEANGFSGKIKEQKLCAFLDSKRIIHPPELELDDGETVPLFDTSIQWGVRRT